MALKTDYKDDILDSSMNGQRQFQIVNNENDTISLKDKTVYQQEGDTLTAEVLNEAFGYINNLMSKFSLNNIYLQIILIYSHSLIYLLYNLIKSH